ncbi:hypothetical protein MSAN_00682300 [Mycena sanguinolenta]|uniref:Uncharacterized protein n=1 Tax=Mycena sanguinolenta TaxID=230812 RepID=A0A8H6Z778_9AGAR|nr:hypothetical protein MSAN_00682300 [Mycena sanguinolenta]
MQANENAKGKAEGRTNLLPKIIYSIRHLSERPLWRVTKQPELRDMKRRRQKRTASIFRDTPRGPAIARNKPVKNAVNGQMDSKKEEETPNPRPLAGKVTKTRGCLHLNWESFWTEKVVEPLDDRKMTAARVNRAACESQL